MPKLLSAEAIAQFAEEGYYYPLRILDEEQAASYRAQLENFEKLALSRFEKLNSDIKVADEKRYLTPIRVEEFYASKVLCRCYSTI